MSRAGEYHESDPCGSLVLRLWPILTTFASSLKDPKGNTAVQSPKNIGAKCVRDFFTIMF